MVLQWLAGCLELGSGFISSWLVVDFFLVSLAIVTSQKLVFPLVKSYRLGKLLCKLCGTDDDKHWFYGHTKKFGFSEKGLHNIANRTIKFPSKFCSWVGPFIPQVSVYHPITVVPALAHSAPKNEIVYRFIRPWIGDGLLTSHGKKWQRNRRLLTPAFHYNILKPYLKVFNNCAEILLDNWDCQAGNPVDVTEGVRLMTLDTMLRCAMSFKTNCQGIAGKHPYIQAVSDLTSLTIKRSESPVLLVDWIFFKTAGGKKFKKALNVVHNQAEKVIAQRRRELLSGNDIETDHKQNELSKKVLDFLDILIQAKDENGKGLSDREIRDEVDTFLFEGHDTTASGISWLLYNLAKYPDLQEKCREEIEEIMGEKENLDWEDLTNINYCTMFIKESMRLYPPVPAVGRYLKTTLPLSEDLTIPSHCNLAIQIFGTHHNHHIWEDPERFDPQRFTLENISKRSSHAFIPFSAGPRNCIGQNFAMNEIKVVLCKALKRYRFYLDHNTPPPIMKPNLVLGSENGIIIKFKELKK